MSREEQFKAITNKMREILFRGKRKDNGKWVEGDLMQHYVHHNDFTIVAGGCIYYEVDGKTVGQFTGLADKNGTKIFEGDILRDRCGAIAQLIYRIEKMSYALKSPHTGENEFAKCKHMNELEVIGNIHDNKDLIE